MNGKYTVNTVGTSEFQWNLKARDAQTMLSGKVYPAKADAETVIGQVLWVLLNNKVRISGVTKGRSLEHRVMALT